MNRFFPGLITAVESLGPGNFEPAGPHYTTVGPDHLKEASFKLKYKLADGMVIEFRWQIALKAGRPPYDVATGAPINWDDWECFGYSLHYGRAYDDALFRFDRDDIHGYHVHMRPRPKEHIPAGDVLPDTRDMLPTTFIDVVRKYRRDRQYPLKRKQS